ncbi:putative transcriptional regulatory protein C530,08 [Talaromyces islandicus]|uniref:Putative transcriptional regulatory protein C530,08 n=1 Tax=Talaromyces islandicus TaxID=28573 RepID=A0A0U1LQU4_TALIS|nr:putative transcriptional regulatory protein C530,08 [Talaromyces islandicus]
MARVESLLETLTDRISRGHGDGLTTPSLVPATTNEPQHVLASLPTTGYGGQAEAGPPAGKTEILRRQLISMFPCQDDVDFLFNSSHGWWLIQQHMMPHLPDHIENDSQGLFNITAVSNGHLTSITRLLLCIAISIQQLSPETDLRPLQTTAPLREMMSSIINFLVSNVLSDDEVTGSIEGVECLALQGIYEVNAGNIRRSWLAFRKAITIAQLLGLHRKPFKAPQETLDLVEIKRLHLWYQISRGERYLSTLLGVPSGTGSAVLPFDDKVPWLSTEERYHMHLYHISGLILARNQEDFTHSFSTTQRIGELLDSLAEQMPPAWWEIPTSIPTNRTKEASVEFERVMCQIWHFELETLVHLPFMLRAATDRRYEYSRVSCLNASRNLIRSWISIRESQMTLLFSNLLEFEAFTAATTLLLGLLGPQTSTNEGVLQERYEDSQLVETVVQNFERLKKHGAGMSVDVQSISVIRTLQQFLHGTLSGRLCLEIPFFGIIKIASSGVVQPLEGERILGANACQNTSFSLPAQSTVSSSIRKMDCAPTSMSHRKRYTTKETNENGQRNATNDTPILQVSGVHFQFPEALGVQGGHDTSEWLFEESDMIFFDSLVNTDLGGDWTF